MHYITFNNSVLVLENIRAGLAHVEIMMPGRKTPLRWHNGNTGVWRGQTDVLIFQKKTIRSTRWGRSGYFRR